jgi:trimeric autotransporter adhesin
MRQPLRPWAAVALLALAAGANDAALTALPSGGGPPPRSPTPLGVYEITLTGLATGQFRSTITPVRTVGGPSATLTQVGSGVVFEQVSATLANDGPRSGGQRYISFLYRIRNGTGATVNNLTFLLVSNASTFPGTFVSSLLKSDGTPADSSIAQSMAPTGAVTMGSNGVTMQAPYSDVTQVYADGEIAGISPPSGVTSIFPVGFVVRHRDPAAASRQIPSTTNANQFDGELTIALRMPRQATAAQDVNSITVQVLAVDDSNTYMTETIEEAQDTAAVRRLRQRASLINATVVTVLAGSTAEDPGVDDYSGQRQICSVRTAGTAASPTNYITTPGPYTRLALFFPGEAASACGANFRAGTPNTPSVGTPYTVTLKAMDRYGNVKTAEVDTVSVSRVSGPSATIGSAAALVSGSASINVTYGGSGVSVLSGTGRRLQAAARSIYVP